MSRRKDSRMVRADLAAGGALLRRFAAPLVLALAVGTIALKTIGPVLAGGREPPAPVLRFIALLPPAMLAALIVSGTFADGRSLAIDASAAGLGVGAVALWFRLPLTLAIVLAAATCALVRALT